MANLPDENRVIIFASGGHAVVVADTIEAMIRAGSIEGGKLTRIVGFVDNDRPVGTCVIGIPIIGSDRDLIDIYDGQPITHYAIGLGTVRGGTGKRAALFAVAGRLAARPLTVIHPSAVVSRLAEVGQATVIMAGSVVQPRARIGANVIVNTQASIDHDCVIGDHSHIAPGATLSGGVTVGEDSLIGVGAVVKQSLRIGCGVTIGAGAVVVRDVDDGATVLASPSRVR